VRSADREPLPLDPDECPHGVYEGCRRCLRWYAAAYRAWYASQFIPPWATGETAMRQAQLDAAQALRELKAWRGERSDP
jgi:hypothetical protein